MDSPTSVLLEIGVVVNVLACFAILKMSRTQPLSQCNAILSAHLNLSSLAMAVVLENTTQALPLVVLVTLMDMFTLSLAVTQGHSTVIWTTRLMYRMLVIIALVSTNIHQVPDVLAAETVLLPLHFSISWIGLVAVPETSAIQRHGAR